MAGLLNNPEKAEIAPDLLPAQPQPWPFSSSPLIAAPPPSSCYHRVGSEFQLAATPT